MGLKSFGGSNNIGDLLRKHGKELLGQSFQHYKKLKGDLAKHIQKKPDDQFYNVMAVAEKGTATINILERGNPQLKLKKQMKFKLRFRVFFQTIL